MKSAMSGQKISIVNKLFSAVNIYKSYRKGDFGNCNSDIKDHHKIITDFMMFSSKQINNSRMLDIGCGQTAVQTILFTADGANITGIDLEVPTFTINPIIFYKVLKNNGLERALKSTFRHLLFDRSYFKRLSKSYSEPINLSKADVRNYDSSKMPFVTNEFDFIYSSWVFEHIDKVEATVKEISRILKPNGVARIEFHLFPSLSGGHNLEWHYPDRDLNRERHCPPWDHLLENKFPVNTYLNKLKLKDYDNIFRKYMKIIRIEKNICGSYYLTKNLKDQLFQKGFSEEDLLTESVVFILKSINKV